MQYLVKVLIALAAVAFIIAVMGSVFGFDFIGVDPEGYSRAANNLTLIAIALALVFKKLF